MSPPVKDIGFTFSDDLLEDGFTKFNWNIRTRRFKNGSVMMFLAAALFDLILEPYDLPFYIVGQNLPTIILLVVAFTSRPDLTAKEIRQRELINILSTWSILFCVCSYGSATSDLNAPITTILILVVGQLVIPTNYYQQIFLFTSIIFYLWICLLGFGLFGSHSDYSYIFR